MSQLQEAGLSWKGYFLGMPYDGYRGYCFLVKCNGIPDSDTQYVAKYNGIVNFADMQTPSEFENVTPYSQLASDHRCGQPATTRSSSRLTAKTSQPKRIPTIVVTNKGPRGLKDKTGYNYYSLLASMRHALRWAVCGTAVQPRR
jgi:hypothetical protein